MPSGTAAQMRRAARDQRALREKRYYTADLRGPRCPICHGLTDPRVAAEDSPAHPMCELELSRGNRS